MHVRWGEFGLPLNPDPVEMIALYKSCKPVVDASPPSPMKREQTTFADGDSKTFRVRTQFCLIGSRKQLRDISRKDFKIKMLSKQRVHVAVVVESYHPLGLGRIMAGAIKQARTGLFKTSSRGVGQAMRLACQPISAFGLIIPQGEICVPAYRETDLSGTFTLADLYGEIAKYLD